MGCPVIAEKIYRKDPAAMLYSPLRALIYIDSGDRTLFAVDRPSTVFAGFADPAIADLGTDLDHPLAELLKILGVGATEVLRAAGLVEHRSVDANQGEVMTRRMGRGPSRSPGLSLITRHTQGVVGRAGGEGGPLEPYSWGRQIWVHAAPARQHDPSDSCWQLARFTETATIAVSELVTNACLATQAERLGTPVRLWMLGDGMSLGILVWDASIQHPVPGMPMSLLKADAVSRW